MKAGSKLASTDVDFTTFEGSKAASKHSSTDVDNATRSGGKELPYHSSADVNFTTDSGGQNASNLSSSNIDFTIDSRKGAYDSSSTDVDFAISCCKSGVNHTAFDVKRGTNKLNTIHNPTCPPNPQDLPTVNKRDCLPIVRRIRKSGVHQNRACVDFRQCHGGQSNFVENVGAISHIPKDETRAILKRAGENISFA